MIGSTLTHTEARELAVKYADSGRALRALARTGAIVHGLLVDLDRLAAPDQPDERLYPLLSLYDYATERILGRDTGPVAGWRQT